MTWSKCCLSDGSSSPRTHFLGKKLAKTCSCVTSAASGRSEKRREEERSRFLRSTLHFKGKKKHRGLMTSLLFLFRTIWDVHDSVRVSAWSLKSLLSSSLTDIHNNISQPILLAAIIFYLTLTYYSALIFCFLPRRCWFCFYFYFHLIGHSLHKVGAAFRTGGSRKKW